MCIQQNVLIAHSIRRCEACNNILNPAIDVDTFELVPFLDKVSGTLLHLHLQLDAWCPCHCLRLPADVVNGEHFVGRRSRESTRNVDGQVRDVFVRVVRNEAIIRRICAVQGLRSGKHGKLRGYEENYEGRYGAEEPQRTKMSVVVFFEEEFTEIEFHGAVLRRELMIN